MQNYLYILIWFNSFLDNDDIDGDNQDTVIYITVLCDNLGNLSSKSCTSVFFCRLHVS